MFSYLSLISTALSICACFHLILSQDTSKEEIRMPGIKPSTEDYYVCTSIKVTEEKYITQYEAIANAGTAHHILLFGCDQPNSKKDTWECGTTCKGQSSIMFAWAKNADPTKLPKDVGYHIGGSSGINHIVMQVHYARALTAADPPDRSGIAFYTSTHKPKYTQGIIILVTGFGSIPPHKEESHLDISCHYSGKKTIHPFAYRTHAHSLSTVISAYRRPADQPQGKWETLGKGNPQWPQAFYPMEQPHVIQHNDILVARCVFNSTSRDTVTYIGSAHTDEMCNFYMMYYVEGEADFVQCNGNQLPAQARSMPADSLQRLPPNPLLDEKAASHHHHHGSSGGSSSSSAIDGSKSYSNSNSGSNYHVISDSDSIVSSTTVGSDSSSYSSGSSHIGITSDDIIGDSSSNSSDNSSIVGSSPTPPQTTESIASPYMDEVRDWYTAPKDIKVGQLGGVDTDSEGNIVIFHRGSHVWNGSSFNWNNVYANQDNVAIPEKTLVKLNQSGYAIDAWGDNMFYLPHGITIDKDDNIWLTDVALHQVFKFDATERTTPSLTLGQRFKPGSDELSFCKPADVAVMSDGSFYVADGYCNGRILHFTKDGHVIRQWGAVAARRRNPPPYRFAIVHSLALSESKNLLCVADRNNQRMQCFNLEGKLRYEYDDTEDVFAVAFVPHSDKLVAVTSSKAKNTGNLLLLQMNTDSAGKVGEFTPKEKKFSVLHDVAVSRDGKRAYIAQLSPAYVYQFTIQTSFHTSGTWKKQQGTGKTVSLNNPTERNCDNSAKFQKVPIIVAGMLVVPVVCVLLVLLGYKIHKRRNGGQLDKLYMNRLFSGTPRRNMAGFSPLATHEELFTDEEEEFSNDEKFFIKL